MAIFFTKRGKLDNWYRQKTKELDNNYFASNDTNNGSDGLTAAQRANKLNKELENAKKALKQEYLQRLQDMGQKPRSDF